MRRILFVDDEPHIVESLRDSLRPQRNEWSMTFACGGEEALERLGDEPFDVVVADMRMPGIDGATLLERVRDERPDAVRIVLSGHAEVEAAVRAASVAHLFLAKPCGPDDLRGAIERACGLRELLAQDELRRAASGASALPSPPSTYLSLRRATADPDATTADIAAIVERDVAMSAKVLQLVNSAFFGLGRRIGDVDEAVRYIGLGVLNALTASVGAFQSFAPVRPIEGFDIDGLQEHSMLTARIAGRLLPDKHAADAAFTAGLLHDVGHLVLAARSPLEFEATLRAARDAGRPLHEVEADRHGASHAELGAYVLGLWGLPHAVVEAVAHHHAPARVEPVGLDAVVAVHVADHLAREVLPAAGVPLPPLDEGLLERLGLLDRLGEWRAAAAAALGG